MQVSAEIRWFWKNILPPKLKEWFCNAKDNTCAAGGGKPRVDEYLYDRSQIELGLKRRGGKPGVEVKGLVTGKWGSLIASPFVGPIELWTKWTSEVLELNSGWTVPTEKIRWLRKFDTAKQLPEEIPLDSKEKPLGNRALPALGFGGVDAVRVGKAIRLSVEAASANDARATVEDLCERFLTNPVIEAAAVTVEAPDQP